MKSSSLKSYLKSSIRTASGQSVSLNHPDDVVTDPRLSLDEKRALLAAWASDAHAVEDEPTLRQLDNGAVVSLTEIRRAIDQLDHDEPKLVAEAKAWGFPSARRHSPVGARKMKLSRRWRYDDDDDDPPPSPVHAAVPRQKHPFVTLGQRLCRA